MFVEEQVKVVLPKLAIIVGLKLEPHWLLGLLVCFVKFYKNRKENF
jgi:hypothetical protein